MANPIVEHIPVVWRSSMLKFMPQAYMVLICAVSSAACLASDEPTSTGSAKLSAAQAAAPIGEIVALNAGGGDQDYFVADADFELGDILTTSEPVSAGNVFLGGPAAIYSDARQGDHFSYTITGLQPGLLHTIILHFAELHWSLPRQRRFNVSVNGATVLIDFDIVSAANGPLRAVTQVFFKRSDDNGTIKIEFSRGAVDQPMVNGVEVRFISG
jgi:hypothetical protein